MEEIKMIKLDEFVEVINKNDNGGIVRKLDELGRIVIPIEYRSGIVEERSYKYRNVSGS